MGDMDDVGESNEAPAGTSTRKYEDALPRVMIPGPPSGPALPPLPGTVRFEFHELPRQMVEMLRTKHSMTYHSIAKLGELEERKRLLEEEMSRAYQQVVDDRRGTASLEASLILSLTGKEGSFGRLLLDQEVFIENLDPDSPEDFALNLLRAKMTMDEGTKK